MMLDSAVDRARPAGETRVTGRVVQGYRVASGLTVDPYFQGGSIRQQLPHFVRAGLKDAARMWPGTINIELAAPLDYTGLAPVLDETIQWHPEYRERFLLYPASLVHEGTAHAGYIYRIDPATQAGHFHDARVTQALMPWISGLEDGAVVTLAY